MCTEKKKSTWGELFIGACVVTTTALVVDEFVFDGAGREKVMGLFGKADTPDLTEAFDALEAVGDQ